MNQDHSDHRTVKNQLEYLEESRRSEETCCQSEFSEKLAVKISVKNLHGMKIILKGLPHSGANEMSCLFILSFTTIYLYFTSTASHTVYVQYCISVYA